MKNKHILKNFIVLEGIDGAGTTTQLDRLTTGLKAKDIPCYRTFEPTDYNTGKAIRTILKGTEQVDPGTMAILFAADRHEHIHHRKEGILPRIEAGDIVVCDRYLFSSMAYQSIECGFDFVYDLNKSFPLPEHLFFLDVPVEVCQERLVKRDFKEIYETRSFQQQVLEGYKKVLCFYADRGMQIHRIDGTQAPGKITGEIVKHLTIAVRG